MTAREYLIFEVDIIPFIIQALVDELWNSHTALKLLNNEHLSIHQVDMNWKTCNNIFGNKIEKMQFNQFWNFLWKTLFLGVTKFFEEKNSNTIWGVGIYLQIISLAFCRKEGDRFGIFGGQIFGFLILRGFLNNRERHWKYHSNLIAFWKLLFIYCLSENG